MHAALWEAEDLWKPRANSVMTSKVRPGEWTASLSLICEASDNGFAGTNPPRASVSNGVTEHSQDAHR